MWHASIAHHGRRGIDSYDQLTRAVRAVQGVGDTTLGEWMEMPGHILHLRRRLSAAEVAETGMVLRDVRGTPEADRLLDPVRHRLPPGYTE